MPRYKNPGPGPVSLASGRVIDVGEDFTTKAALEAEDQTHLDGGRLVEVETATSRKRGADKEPS